MKRRDFITAAIPPEDQSLFKMALDLYDKVKPMRKKDVQMIKEMGLSQNPLFRYNT